MVVFAGIALVCAGSAYYHWAPDNHRLVWDRLPITMVFMAFLSAVIAEHISMRAGALLLPPLLLVGTLSIVYWQRTQLAGHGDLRFYGLVQFLPMLLIPLIMMLFPARYTRSLDLVWVLALYVLAKIFEFLDHSIFSATHGFVSGHTLKHLFAALASWQILRMVMLRRPQAEAT